MKIFFKEPNIDFLKIRHYAFILSGILIGITFISIIIHKGLNLGVDFRGGLVLQVSFEQKIQLSELRKLISLSDIKEYSLQDFVNQNIVVIRIKGTQKEEIASQVKNIISQLNVKFNIDKIEYVGPVIGKYLTKQALLSIVFSFLGIIIYVAFRFKSGVWGVSGVIALVHDVLVAIGVLSVLNYEITLEVIAALLTLAGYSINDTIVIYDRIRENFTLMKKQSLYEIINKSINQTLSRTIITSLTVEFVLLALLLFGGEVLRGFSLALFVGCISGTYSTIFIATAIVYDWKTTRP